MYKDVPSSTIYYNNNNQDQLKYLSIKGRIGKKTKVELEKKTHIDGLCQRGNNNNKSQLKNLPVAKT